MAVQDEKWRETAWNLYCAFSTYREAQEAMEAARRATYRGFYPFARYIAARHNFTEANVSIEAAIGTAGVKVFVCALAYEIEHGQPPSDKLPQTLRDDAIPDYYDALAPITFEIRRLADGVYAPGIAIAPGAFRDDATMMAYLQTEIPMLSERMHREQLTSLSTFDTATGAAFDKWQDRMEVLHRRLHDQGLPEWSANESERAPYLQEKGFSSTDAALIAAHAAYIAPEFGPHGYVFERFPSPDTATANLLRSQSLSNRERPKSQLARYAEWWAAVCGPPGRVNPQYVRTWADVAREHGVKEASILRREIPKMEVTHGLNSDRKGKTAASRKKKRDM